jgi:hypothetical protein
MTTKRIDNGVVYTPADLALEVATQAKEICDELDYSPRFVVDPCCGQGDLLKAGESVFGVGPSYCLGHDIEQASVEAAKHLGYDCDQGDLFDPHGYPGNSVFLLNPPYVGRSNLSRIVGDDRFKWLKKTYKEKKAGSCDLAGYVLRHILEAHRPRVMTVIATNTIFQGSTRVVGTKWAANNGYRIANVTGNIPWSGAAVTVQIFSLVNFDYFG